MTRLRERPEFAEENKRLINIWMERGANHDDMENGVGEFASDEFKRHFAEWIEELKGGQ